ncbi:hypothetical protein F9277_10850 [Vibrio harveyi]|nr:hypothetical protein F9277_10850 [Vibrio harveyi]
MACILCWRLLIELYETFKSPPCLQTKSFSLNPVILTKSSITRLLGYRHDIMFVHYSADIFFLQLKSDRLS